MAEPFVWGGSGERLTPEAIKRQRAVAAAMLKNGMDYSPVQHWTQGLARVAQALVGGYEEGKLDKAERANAAADSATSQALVAQLLGGASAPSASPAQAPTAPTMAGGDGARSMSMPGVTPDMKTGIADAAKALGISPVDLATTISYETGGTFNPTQAGPTTKWGQHRGLIQFGEPQAKQYGVDWSNPAASQLGANGAIVAYLRDRGVKPGMGLMDIYSTINAGAPGLYDRSDTAAGGAPGTVADKVNNQMGKHRARAQAMFADLPATGASPVSQETGQPGFAIPPAPQPAAMSGMQFNAIHANDVVPPVFQSEGVSQPWMGTALPSEPAAPAMVASPLPPSRPADLALPQADLPAPGAVPAIGQFPTAPMEDLSNSPGAGGREGLVQALMQQQGQSTPAGVAAPAAATPVQRVAQAVAGASAAPAQSNDSALAAALTSDNPALQRVASAVIASRLEQQQGNRGVVVGERIVDPRNGRVIADFTTGSNAQINRDVEARRQEAARAGLKPDSPGYQSYVLTGKMPREDAQPLTATDKKAIMEADEAVLSNETAIKSLKEALRLSPLANAGFGAGVRAQAGNILPDAVIPDALSSPSSSKATVELENVVLTNALGSLKAIFGAAPTEGERKILLEIQGSVSQPREVRESIYNRALEMAEKRLSFNRDRASQLRGGDYYKADRKPAAGAGTPADDGGWQDMGGGVRLRKKQ